MAESKPFVETPEEREAAEVTPFASAEDAVGGGEDPGEATLLDTYRAAWRLLRPDRVAKQTGRLWFESLKIATGLSTIDYHPKDWRFKDPVWRENPFYKRLGQFYLAYTDAVESLLKEGADAAPNMDWREKERARFASDLLTTTPAPTNTLLGNPAALRELVDTRGGSLLKGTRSFARDMLYNGGLPQQVDRSTFELGKNLAATPGAVIHRDEVLELVRYTPGTKEVYARPTLVITPQINKYYFMDLSPGRSFVEYSVFRGIQTFITSWRMPTAEEAHWDVDTYSKSLLEAIDVIREVTGSGQVNVIGLCAGGIQTALLLNLLAARNDERVHVASFAVTLLDWNVPAMIGAFHSPPMLNLARRRAASKGVMPAMDLARTFSWLRPNDLVWNYWVNNYLMGKDPPKFDILAWNSDSTNVPLALHEQFLELFEHNLLPQPRAFEAMGEPVDLKTIKCETFVTGAIADHLTPWRGCYRTTQLLGGSSRFVLSNAGHIAGLVNPPGNPKASYFDGPEPGPDPDDWLRSATEHQGSWWEVWADWMTDRSGDNVAAPKNLGSRKHPELERAPGRYVKEKRG